MTLAGWAVAGVAVAGLLWAARRWPRFARGGLVALTFVELWLGARALPFTLATAPAATSLRNAPAALLAATQDQAPAGRDRFLSLSDIRFDPGDLAELRASQAGRLSPDAVERLVRAAKQVEVIAPNLPLLYNLPAVDGYDGGLLPLGRYVQLQSLFLPPELLMPDGRLREQLRGVPDDRLLDLTGVRFVDHRQAARSVGRRRVLRPRAGRTAGARTGVGSRSLHLSALLGHRTGRRGGGGK